MGHYTRWDAVSLSISDETLEPARTKDGSSQIRQDGQLSAATAQTLADEHDVPIEAVEDIADAVANRQK